ncbi:SRPBCC family protein [Janibacter alittae]|uniref:SRPBCC family protein n=1 Tax=Janibacter alittae TaxID=3115209 RepID=A0ABZ2MGK4_9MICO
MTRQKSVSDSVVIDVDPQTAYAAVSDITQMGRWSPENLGGTLDGGAEGPATGSVTVGTSFIGRNRRGRAQWVTGCTVTAADPGERFAFRVHRIGIGAPRITGKIATWDYRFEAVDGGTRVTETWTDDRPWPDVVATVFDTVATGGRTFAQFQKGNIRRTLDRLRSELEDGRRTDDSRG